jgi:hypothetical protein
VERNRIWKKWDEEEAGLLLGAGGEVSGRETEQGEGGLDGTMDSDGGSGREYDERILDEDYEMKGGDEEVDGIDDADDGEDESGSEKSAGSENSADSKQDERIVDEEGKAPAIQPEQARSPEQDSEDVGGNKEVATAALTAAGAKERTAGIPVSGNDHGASGGKVGAKNGNGKGKEDRMEGKKKEIHVKADGGRGRETEDSEVEIEEDDSKDMRDPSLRPDHRYHAVRSQLSNSQFPRKLNPKMKTCQKKDDGFLSKEMRDGTGITTTAVLREPSMCPAHSHTTGSASHAFTTGTVPGRAGMASQSCWLPQTTTSPPTSQWTGRGSASGSCVLSQGVWMR